MNRKVNGDLAAWMSRAGIPADMIAHQFEASESTVRKAVAETHRRLSRQAKLAAAKRGRETLKRRADKTKPDYYRHLRKPVSAEVAAFFSGASR